MTIAEVVSIIEKRWPIGMAEDFDNVGLLCGIPCRKLTGILICHDALEDVIDEAIEKNCNFVLCFHPIIFSGVKSLTGRNYVERSVMKALENKIAIYALHTSVDNDRFGLSYFMCKRLELENLKVLIPKKNQLSYITLFTPKGSEKQLEKAVFSAGAGQIGNYDNCRFLLEGEGSFRPLKGANPSIGSLSKREFVQEVQLSFIFESYKKSGVLRAIRESHPYEEISYQIYNLDNENYYEGLGQYGELKDYVQAEDFFYLLKKTFNLKIIRHSKILSKKVKKIGLLGGSGAFGIKAAINVGCDIYISGDFKYHDFFLAENNIILADIGHFESEQFVVDQLYEFLSEKITNFAILRTVKKTNPVNYFL